MPRRLARTHMVDLGNAVEAQDNRCHYRYVRQPLGTSIGNLFRDLGSPGYSERTGERADVTEFICELAKSCLEISQCGY